MADTVPDTILARFARAVDAFDPAYPALILTHNDADGLSAGAILSHAFARAGRPARIRILGRGENPWSPEMRAELADQDIGGLVVADLGMRDGSPKPGTPMVVIDHHVPVGTPEGTVLTGYGLDPIPTASLLAFHCAGALAGVDDLLWLAAVGLVGDLGDKAPFPELAAAKSAYTATAIKECVSLVNAPRRTAEGDAAPALALLLAAQNPKDAIGDRHQEAATLKAARAAVRDALEAAKRLPPRVRGDVALILMDTPFQIHPLVAQAWRLRLRDKLVIAANTGYRPGWVHFAMRSATGRDLIAYLAERRPPGADENYGGGHREATGGALRPDDWEHFMTGLGFGADVAVAATDAAVAA